MWANVTETSQGRVTQVCHHQIIGFLCLWPCGAHRAATSSCIDPARMPNNLDDLRQLIDADAVEPARRGSFCVQFAGSGHYFDERADALAYLCKRWRGSFITKHLEDACALAATRQPAALVAARKRARMWQNMEILGGEEPD